MPNLNPGILKSQAQTRLAGSNSTYLVLIHTGLLLTLTILASGINLFLNHQISGTGGLSGLSTRSMLQSFQTFLHQGTTLFTPFWKAGFTLCMLRIAQGNYPASKDLLGGFRRWGSVLSLQLFHMIFLFGLFLSTSYLAATLFALTPFASSMTDLLAPMMESGTLDLSAIPTDALVDAYLPLVGLYLMILLPLLLFYSLSTRMSSYLIMDQNMGGFLSIHFSMASMRGFRIKMLKLDLSFWWYYLIEVLLSVVCYLDVILPLLGVTLPFNETVAFFAALILYAILELGFHLWKKPYHDTTYALAYREILHSLEYRNQTES